MSQTLIPDHRDGALKLENVANRLVHHCKIVNVKWKTVKAPTIPLPIKPPIVFGPWPQFIQHFGPVPRQCACLPGQACGNVACPYRLMATGAQYVSQTMGNC